MKALIDCYARIIYAIPFAIFGLMHFMKGGDMAGMVPSFIPGGIFWVYLVGVALIAAAVAIIIKTCKISLFVVSAYAVNFYSYHAHTYGDGRSNKANGYVQFIKGLGPYGWSIIGGREIW